MSAEVADVNHEPYFENETEHELIVPSTQTEISEFEHRVTRHETIHDMEGFYWLLCWLCISFTGPGKRVDIRMESSNDQALGTIIEDLFEGDSFKVNVASKRLIITNRAKFQKRILNHMQAYFHPRDWSLVTVIKLYLSNFVLNFLPAYLPSCQLM